MSNRLPSCVGKTHGEIWDMYRVAYADLDERSLREIHNRWVYAYATVAPPKKGK